jgi:hypothetical protein
MSKKPEGDQTGVEVQVLDRVTKVYFRPHARELMKEYNLTEAMLRYLAGVYGGYPYAHPQMEKALIRRGLRRMTHDEGVTYTLKGRNVCHKLFYKVAPVQARK